ncbi:MAG: Rpn family recombination-promoting nuclease/putative transposase, partial [Spirochaetales bacterium]|jgi:predicted transposase/invertase (TIGR01784 family)|nr:Rpn family recombination-promoting nuclease/putative transposase [Spirochaetales bacterium]
MAIHKAKDNSFKIILGNHELFVEFLRDFIPISILKDIKPEDIEDMSERFLPLFQEGRDSDTVKRINLQGTPLFVIAIAEHESSVNYRASFKMLQYICLVLDQYEKDVNKEHLISFTKEFLYPPVLPIIFYDGSETWTAQMNFSDRTEMKDVFSKYIPKFEYELVDLNRYSLEDIVSFRDALSVIMLIDKWSRQKGGIAQLGKLPRDYFASLNIPKSLTKLLTDVMTVLLDRLKMPKEEIHEITDLIEKKEGSYMFDRFVESVLEDKRLAVENAREETRAEADEKAYQRQLESARKLKSKGYPVSDIAESLSLPEETVTAL